MQQGLVLTLVRYWSWSGLLIIPHYYVQGDSGGGMVGVNTGYGGYSLVGITSWGRGCAVEGTFGVYTRVEYYLEWIAQIFQDEA